MSFQELRAALDAYQDAVAQKGGDTSAVRALSGLLSVDNDETPAKEVLKAAAKAMKDQIRLANPTEVRAGAAAASLAAFERLAEAFGAKAALGKQAKELREFLENHAEWPVDGVAQAAATELEKKRVASAKRAAKAAKK